MHQDVVNLLVVCRGSSSRARDTDELKKRIGKAGSVLGTWLGPWEQVVERRVLNKLLHIMEKSSHPLHSLLVKLRSIFSPRRLLLHCKEWYRKSFYSQHPVQWLYSDRELCSYSLTICCGTDFIFYYYTTDPQFIKLQHACYYIGFFCRLIATYSCLSLNV